jgi:hypothetical protein
MKLIVTNAFADFAKGDQITDQAAIDAVLASDNAGNVVKVADAPADPPADTPKPAKRNA